MFKFKNMLLTQVFTLFISGEVLGEGSPLSEFYAAYSRRNYAQVNQLSEEAFLSLPSEEEIMSLISTNPKDEKVDKMMEYLMKASIAGVFSENTEEILMCIHRLKKLPLIQNYFHSVELCKALGMHQEVIEFMKKEIEQEATKLTEEIKKTIKERLSGLSNIVISMKPSIRTAQRSLEFVNSYIYGSNEDPSRRNRIFLLDLDLLSGLLNLSLFAYYYEDKNPKAYDVFENVMNFVNSREPSVKEKTIQKMARVVVDHDLYEERFPGISDEDYELLKKAVERVSVKGFKKKKPLARKLTAEEKKAAEDAANLVLEELLKEEKVVKQAEKNKKANKTKNKTNPSESDSKLPADTQTPETASHEENLKRNPVQVVSAKGEASMVGFFQTSSKEDTLLGELLDEKNTSEKLRKDLEKIKKMLVKANEEKHLLAEENEKLEQEIARREADKLEGRERGRVRHQKLQQLESLISELKNKLEKASRNVHTSGIKMEEERHVELEHLSQEEIESEGLYLENMQVELERLRLMEEQFNNFLYIHYDELQKAFWNGRNVGYFQLSQKAAFQQFGIGEYDPNLPPVPGVVTESGEWCRICNLNGVEGFYLGGVFYPLQL